MSNSMRSGGGDRSRVNWSHQHPHPGHLPPKSPSQPPPPAPPPPTSSGSASGPFPGCVRVPNFGAAHRRSPSASFVPDVEPSWLEELLDSPKAEQRSTSSSTSMLRAASHHRRSASDSFTFLDAPSNFPRICDIAEEDEFMDAYANSRFAMDHHHLQEQQLQRDRDDRLASMLRGMNLHQQQQPQGSSRLRSMEAASWEHSRVHPHPPHRNHQNLPAPGDHDTVDQGSMDGDATAGNGDQCTDPKRSKRQSAQRSRVRKLQYIAELETNVADLQNEVSQKSTQKALLEHQRIALHLENAALKQSYNAMAQEWRYKEAHTDALRKELQRLQHLQQQQQRRSQQQLSLSSSTNATTTYTNNNSSSSNNNNNMINNKSNVVEGKHLRRASAGSVTDIGSGTSSAADVLDSFVRFQVEKTTDTPASSVLRSSCTLAGNNGKNLETTTSSSKGRLLLQPSGAPSLPPPGFVLQHQ